MVTACHYYNLFQTILHQQGEKFQKIFQGVEKLCVGVEGGGRIGGGGGGAVFIAVTAKPTEL